MLLDLKYFLFQNLKNNNVKFNDKKKKTLLLSSQKHLKKWNIAKVSFK